MTRRLPRRSLAVVSPLVLRRALACYQVNATESRVPIEERWAKALPEVPSASYPELLERCKAIESHAYNLGMARLDGNVDAATAKLDLAENFPELDEEAIERTWERGALYAAR